MANQYAKSFVYATTAESTSTPGRANPKSTSNTTKETKKMPTYNTTRLDCPYCAVTWQWPNESLLSDSSIKCPTCKQQIAICYYETREGIKYRVVDGCDATFYIPILTAKSFRRQLVRLAP